MKELNEETVRQYFLDNGGWKLVSDYTGNHDALTVEKDGYYSTISFASFQKGHKPILFGSKNKFFKDNIKLFLSRKDDSITFVDAFLVRKSGKARIEVHMLDALKHKFIRTWEHIYLEKGALCCPRCSRKLQTQRHRDKMFDKWFNLIDFDKFVVLEKPHYLTADSRIRLEEKETGYRYNIYIRAFEHDYAIEAFNAFSNKDYYLYNLVKYAENNGLYSKPVEIVDTSKQQNLVKFKCQCGNEFTRGVNRWMSGRDLCRKCANASSSYERLVEDFLQNNDIDYIQEYRYNSCRDIKPLPFDFYLTKYNCLIEIDGEQHYSSVCFGGNYEDIEKRFLLQQQHDKIKTDFCKTHDIPFLRIPYFDFHSEVWKEKILDFIKPLRCNES